MAQTMEKVQKTKGTLKTVYYLPALGGFLERSRIE